MDCPKESSGSYTAQNGQYYGRYQLTITYLNGDLSPANQESGQSICCPTVMDHGQQLKISGCKWLVLNSFEKEFLNRTF